MSTGSHEPDETTADIDQPDAATAATTTPEPESTGRDGRGRRWAVVAAGAVVAAVAAGTAIAVTADGGDDTTTSASATVATTDEATTSSTGMTTTTGATTSSMDTATTEAPAVTDPTVTTTPGGTELPRDPNGYAAAAFLAWQQGDDATLELLTSPAALAVLTAHDPGTGQWTGPVSEGAAGSSYCTWNGPEGQLVLRVANEAASTGQPHAVHEARFLASSG